MGTSHKSLAPNKCEGIQKQYLKHGIHSRYLHGVRIELFFPFFSTASQTLVTWWKRSGYLEGCLPLGLSGYHDHGYYAFGGGCSWRSLEGEAGGRTVDACSDSLVGVAVQWSWHSSGLRA